MSTPTATPPSSSNPHRLKAIPLSQALSQSSYSRLSTGSDALNAHLNGGISRGQTVEISGPPGSGKTQFLIQLLTSALSQTPPRAVVWISCKTPPVFPPRLPLARITHFTTPTLSHLLALLLHAPTRLPADFALLAIDDVSTLFTAAFPPGMEQKSSKSSKSARRFPVMLQLITELSRLAAMRSAVVAVSVHMSTRVVKGFGGILQSSLSAPQWNNGLSIRLAVLRRGKGEREVRVVKMDGKDAGEDGLARCKIVVGGGGWADAHAEDEEAALEVWRDQVKGSPSAVSSEQIKSQKPPPPPVPPHPQKTPLKSAAATVLTGKRKRAPSGIAAGIIPDSDDEDGDLDDDEDEEELMVREFGWGDDGIFEIGEKGVQEEEQEAEDQVERSDAVKFGPTITNGDEKHAE